MQTDNPPVDLRMHFINLLGQSTNQLRTVANSLEEVSAYLQTTPHSPFPAQMQQMIQMWSGAQAPPNGIPAPIPASVPAARGRKRRVDVATDGAEPELNEDGKKKRKRATPSEKKARRDPDAPKRPPSAYLLFQNEVRKEMQQVFPNSPYHDVLNKIADRWKKMTTDEKKHYVDLTNESKKIFEVNKAAYEVEKAAKIETASTPDAVVAPVTATPIIPVVAPIAPVAAVVEETEDSGDEESSETSSVAVSTLTKDVESKDTDESESEGEDSDEDEESAQKKNVKKEEATKAAPPAKPSSKAKPESTKGKKNSQKKESE